jgi:gliding motility-associated-like protein
LLKVSVKALPLAISLLENHYKDQLLMKIFTRIAFLLIVLLAGFQSKAQVTANFSANFTVGCAPLLVQFTDLSTGGVTSWNWDLGNGTLSTLPNPSTTYTLPGQYTVTLTVSNGTSSNTKTVTAYINIYGSPVVAFSANDTAGCPPHTVGFTNATTLGTPGAGTYSWIFGDGYSSTQVSPSHTYQLPGYYNVTLIATNSGGCTKSLTKPSYIHVYEPPAIAFTAPQSYCITPGVATFNSTITGTPPYAYSWTFGDGGTSSVANPTHTYALAGIYTVTLIVTDGHGCIDTLAKPNYISVSTLTAGFTGPAAACENAQVVFSNTSAGASSAYWDFGDGGTSTSINGAHVYTTDGPYNVMLVAFNGTCSDTVIIPIIIHPAPEAEFEGIPIHPCPAPAQIHYDNQSTGASTYAWSFGDNGTSTQNNPNHTYNQNGYYTVTLVATSAFGCKDTITKPQYMQVFDLILDAGAIPYSGCAPLTVDFSTATYSTMPSSGALYPYGTSSWFWDLDDNATSTDTTPVHTYNDTGTYHITVTITTENGCVITDSLQVLVGPLPVAHFTASPDTICVNGEVTFVNQTTGATSYIWDFGDGGATSTTNAVHTFNTSGQWTITLHAYNNGCEDTFMVDSMILVYPPTSIFSYINDCDTPTLVKFTNSSIDPTSYIWYFGDGTSSTVLNPEHNYPALGNYNAMLVTFNSVYGCSDSSILPIHLVDPVGNFVANDTAICKGDTVHFTSTYSGFAIRYDWYVDNTWIPDTTANLDYRFLNTGIYDTKVIITDEHSCIDSVVRPHYILVAKPDADFVASPTVGCSPLNVLFTNTSTDVTGTYYTNMLWDFGNGTASVGTPTVNNVYPPGIYTVQMIVTDNVGCKDTLIKPTYIESRHPHAGFSVVDTAVCIGQTISFSNTSTGVALSASWDFGDGTGSSSVAATHAYSATGNYTVRLIVTDPTGCKDTMTRNNYINITKPDAGFVMSDTFAICPPLHVFFTNTTTGALINNWAFGDGSGSTLSNPDNAYTAPGIYDIQLVVTNGQGCKDTATGHVNVLGYAGGLSYTPLDGCAPLEVSFVANLTNVPSLVWDFSDGVTSAANGSSTTVHTYVTPGAYVPKLILSDGAGCLNSSDGLDTIRVDGILAGFISTPVCEKTIVQFQDTSFSFFSPILTWAWTFNNGQQTSNLNNPTQFYPNTGSFPVGLIVTNAHGCADTIFRNLTVYPLPVISAGLDTVVCVGDAAQLTGTGGVSYVWSPAATLSCTGCTSPLATPQVPTSYVVSGTDAHGCVSTDTVSVNLQTTTTSRVGDDGAICQDSSFQLMAMDAQHYQWSPAASLNDPNIADPIATPTSTTIYTVLAFEGSCLPDSHKVEVIVHPKPVVDAGSDQTIVAGKSTMIQSSGTLISTFLWTPAATLSCDICSNPTASPLTTTTYQVTVASMYGCKSSDTVTIHVLCDQSQLFIPNSFTPNNDGQNDVFYVRGVGLKTISAIRIYNRWGEVVFERKGINLNDKSNAWDGTYKGAVLNPDIFVYVIEGICDTGEPINWKGDVSLIR